MYEFVTLDEEQKHVRRQLLDRYGHIAQLSAALPVLALQVYFLASWIVARVSRNGLNGPKSPVKRSRHAANVSNLLSSVRKVIWWAGDDLTICGFDLGTNGECLGAVSWLAWLVLLSFLQTGNDYLHLTKRFGIVAASQLPLHFLLAIKTPYSPLQALTHASHGSLNAAHQILGRIITLLIYCHVILYLNFYLQSGLLMAKLKEAYVLCGVFATISFTIIGTSSLECVRRASYRIFLGIHIALSTAILPILFFHVHHIREYLYETLAVVLLNLVLRALTVQSYTAANVTLVPQTSLMDVAIKLNGNTLASRWHPGQHAYLSIPGRASRAALTKNPFTLASVPASDKQLRFVARVQQGNTAILAAAAAEKSVQHILVEGPYGLKSHNDTLLEYDRVLLVAGGIGATFILPIYRQLLADLSPSKGSYRRQKVSAVWVTRSLTEVHWALPENTNEREGFLERLSIYVTDSGGRVRSRPTSGNAVQMNLPRPQMDEEEIEMEERAGLLKADMDSLSAESSHPKLETTSGRPELSLIVRQTFSGGQEERVAVVVCGPDGLTKMIRLEVGRWVHKGRDVWFWNERFAF